MAADNAHYREIAEKRRILRQEYGGLMTVSELGREVGYKDSRDARRWAQEVGLEPVQMGRKVKYDVDQLAKIIVMRRGMA
ncbi:MAG: hypothetical protein LUD69_07485 [Oscillospiraceae bacterium]|nr:hypothetical protein [Oscillospiraceae bacterium]